MSNPVGKNHCRGYGIHSCVAHGLILLEIKLIARPPRRMTTLHNRGAGVNIATLRQSIGATSLFGHGGRSGDVCFLGVGRTSLASASLVAGTKPVSAPIE